MVSCADPMHSVCARDLGQDLAVTYYERILTEVVSTDQMQWGLYTQPRSRFSHTDQLCSVNNMFIINYGKSKSEQLCSWFVLTDILLANRDEPNLILPKFARPLYFVYFAISFLVLTGTETNIVRWNCQSFCILVCNFFIAKRYRSKCWSRWENLDCGQYRFQPIKLVNLVVLSPHETEPYNNLPYRPACLKYRYPAGEFKNSEINSRKSCWWDFVLVILLIVLSPHFVVF